MCVYGCVRVYARVCACLYVFVTSMHVISDVTNAFSGCPTHVLNAQMALRCEFSIVTGSL